MSSDAAAAAAAAAAATATDYYALLGVEKTASPEDIKKAYRRMSLKCHPDRNNGTAEATDNFQKLTNAYETLGDEDKRKQYDFQLRFGNKLPPVFRMDGDLDPADILNFLSQSFMQGAGFMQGTGFTQGPSFMQGAGPSFMQGAGPSFMQGTSFMQGPAGIGFMNAFTKPVPIILTEEISLSKAYLGGTIPVEVTRWVTEGDVRREETETIYLPLPKGVDNNEIIIVR